MTLGVAVDAGGGAASVLSAAPISFGDPSLIPSSIMRPSASCLETGLLHPVSPVWGKCRFKVRSG